MPEQLYRIKPLEWEPRPDGTGFQAHTAFGRYLTYRLKWKCPGGTWHAAGNMEAKGAAEADYREMLGELLVLEPVPAPAAADALAGAEADAKGVE